MSSFFLRVSSFNQIENSMKPHWRWPYTSLLSYLMWGGSIFQRQSMLRTRYINFRIMTRKKKKKSGPWKVRKKRMPWRFSLWIRALLMVWTDRCNGKCFLDSSNRLMMKCADEEWKYLASSPINPYVYPNPLLVWCLRPRTLLVFLTSALAASARSKPPILESIGSAMFFEVSTEG